ncbi:helix-turn-helix domain-containing protein [Paraburkholderia sp. BL10I2N1]|uniref:IclR family transcriptional regulator n=2 Tax=unclassified Paraburkholderia TaxID=2615204 RepID=UPI00106183D5|nr:helix-turn-helix domain-containing protein [Paraburkholderia sp. BL10I2N1]TDN62370.1 IclR family transcriptional regulator [Paraburkholderia sp. BL10I2N1]
MSLRTHHGDASVAAREEAGLDAAAMERGAGAQGACGGAMVVPLARSIAVLAAFRPQEPWLGNQDIVLETGIPAPTVSRMLRSLLTLGYLRYSPERRKYRLSASVLSLGYAAIAHSNVQRLARLGMQSFADANETYVVLGTRDRLDVIVLETCAGKAASVDLGLYVGTRLSIASSPMGWALLSALPELERFYLLGNIERKAGRDWPHLRHRISEGISQALNTGYCASLGEWEPELSIVAAPLTIPDHAPLVLACIGHSARMGRARLERELAPRLVAAARSLQEKALFVD